MFLFLLLSLCTSFKEGEFFSFYLPSPSFARGGAFQGRGVDARSVSSTQRVLLLFLTTLRRYNKHRKNRIYSGKNQRIFFLRQPLLFVQIHI